jgi:TIR domain-containing protein
MTTSSRAAPCRIFINYRREETAYPAGWLFDRLTQHFGKGQIFKDIDSIHLGDDFVEAMTSAVGSCDVLLALIGDRWTVVTDRDGGRRIDNPNDYVRMEIEAALERNTLVIPILVGGAQMPTANELPPSLANLVRRNALELSPSRFDADAGRLLAVLDESLARAESAREAAHGGPGRVPEPVRVPADRGPEPPSGGPGRGKPPGRPWWRVSRRAGILAAAAVGAALIVALAAVLLTRPHPATPAGASSAPAGASSASVLFQDDFSSTVNGWQVVTGGSGGYGNGAYHIWVPPANDVAIAVPAKAGRLMSASAPRNLSIEATARSIKDPRQEDLYGIACRQGPWGAYIFLVADQGVYLEKWLGPYSTTHDSPIIYLNMRATATNHLRALCTSRGPRAVRLAFWVNGRAVADWTDTQHPFTSGTVGLVNSSLSSVKPTEAEFDNVVVRTAAAG